MKEMTLEEETPATSFEFNEEIKQALRGRLVPAASLDELIEGACSSQSMFFLFRQLAGDPSMKRLLFQRPDDLFPTDDGISFPLMYQGRIVDTDGTELRAIQSKTLDHVVAMEVEFTQQNQNALQNAIGLSPDDLQDTAAELGDVFAYGALRVLQDNPHLTQLLEGEENLTLAAVREALHAEGNEVDLTSLEELGQAMEGEDHSLDPQIQSTIKGLAKKAALGFLAVLERPSTPSSPIPNLATTAHGPVSRWYPRVLDQADLDPNEYGKLLNELYRLRLLRTRDVICWCERCSLKNTAYTKHYGDVAPAELHDESCLSCGRPSSHTALFTLDPGFRDLLFAKDGFLAIYLGWLLTQNEIPFEASHKDVPPESDFLVDDRVLLECKMLRANRDRRQVHEALDSTLGQLKTQLHAREEHGFEIDQAVILWNRWANVAAESLPFADRYIDLVQKYDLTIVGPHQIEEFVNEL